MASSRPVAVEESNPLRFTLVSAVTADVLLACELPAWAGCARK